MVTSYFILILNISYFHYNTNSQNVAHQQPPQSPDLPSLNTQYIPPKYRTSCVFNYRSRRIPAAALAFPPNQPPRLPQSAVDVPTTTRARPRRSPTAYPAAANGSIKIQFRNAVRGRSSPARSISSGTNPPDVPPDSSAPLPPSEAAHTMRPFTELRGRGWDQLGSGDYPGARAGSGITREASFCRKAILRSWRRRFATTGGGGRVLERFLTCCVCIRIWCRSGEDFMLSNVKK